MARQPRVGPGIPPRQGDARAYQLYLNRVVVNPLLRRVDEAVLRAGQSYESIRYAINAIPQDPALQGMATQAAEAHMAKLKAYHTARFTKTMRRYLGVNVRFMDDSVLEPILRAAIKENVALIKTLEPRLHAGITADLTKLAREAPFDRQALQEVLRTKYKSTGYNLRRLTRDQTNKTIGRLTHARHEQAGISEYVWRTVKDQRVRDTHVQNDNKVFQWNTPPSNGTGHPGEDIQCFPGSVGILPAGLHGSVAYRYIGKLIEVVLADGVKVTTTPNHPILTETGWKRAAYIQEGDQLLKHTGGGFSATPTPYPQFSNGDATAEKLHVLFGGSRRVGGSVGRALDLHGAPAGWDEEIDVVEPDVMLRKEMHALGREVFGNIGFKDADAIGSFSKLLSGSAGTAPVPAGFVGLAGQLRLFLLRHGFHADEIGFASGAHWQAKIIQAVNDGLARYLHFGGHPQHSLASVPAGVDFGMVLGPWAGMEFARMGRKAKVPPAGPENLDADSNLSSSLSNGHALFPRLLCSGPVGHAAFSPVRVSRVGSISHDGPIYSFEADSGLIIANGVVTHNCRCFAKPVIPGLPIPAATSQPVTPASAPKAPAAPKAAPKRRRATKQPPVVRPASTPPPTHAIPTPPKGLPPAPKPPKPKAKPARAPRAPSRKKAKRTPAAPKTRSSVPVMPPVAHPIGAPAPGTGFTIPKPPKK